MQKMSDKYKTLSSELIYDGRVISLYKDSVKIGDVCAKREYVRHSGGAAVLAEKDGKFAFVSQYRHPFGKEILEIPAGKREKGEPPEITAKRELSEECGLETDNLKQITSFCVSPGYSDEIIWVYYADTFIEGKIHLDADEVLETVWIEKEKVFKMMESGEIFDGKTIVALLWYKANKR